MVDIDEVDDKKATKKKKRNYTNVRVRVMYNIGNAAAYYRTITVPQTTSTRLEVFIAQFLETTSYSSLLLAIHNSQH